MGQPVFTFKDERLFVNVPREGEFTYLDLVKLAREHTGRGVTIDWVALKEAFRFGRGHAFPVGTLEASELLNEKAKVRFTEDRIRAYLVLYPPKQKGRRMTEHEVREIIAAYGVDEDLLDLKEMRSCLMRRDYGEPHSVAYGAAPVDGEPYSIVWDSPPTDPHGFIMAMAGLEDLPPTILRVVRPAQVAGKRLKPLPGRPGYTVSGETIEPKQSQDPFIIGHGLRIAPNGAMVLSQTRGHLRLTGDGGLKAEVVPVLETDAQQGLSEISKPTFYPGSVIINGDIESAAEIRVMGDLEVRGAIIGAGIQVMGSLIVRDGIINTDRLGIVSGGIVSAAFLEKARVEAHTVHLRRYSLHSKILALDTVLGAKACSVKGGDVEAGSQIMVPILGSTNASPTRVALGNRPCQTLKEVYRGWIQLLERLTGVDPEVADWARREAVRLLELTELYQPKKRFDEGSILAQTVYPGVKVVIGQGMREPGEKLGNVRFTPERIGDKERVAMAKL